MSWRYKYIINLIFSFTYKIFKKGIKKELNEEDVYEMLKDYRAKKLGDKLEKEWNKELKRSQDPSVFRMMMRCFGKTYIMYGFLQLIMKTILMWVINYTTYRTLKLSHIIYYYYCGSKWKSFTYSSNIIRYSILRLTLTSR